MRSHLFLGVATALVSTVVAKTISTTVTTCNCTTSTTATPLSTVNTSVETLFSTSTTVQTVSEVYTPSTTVTIYQNSSSALCDAATTVYLTTTPISTLIITVTTSPTVTGSFSTVIPPFGNQSTPDASSTFLSAPTGWSPWSSKIPAGTASSYTHSKTSTSSTPIATMWHGSAQGLAPPRLFFLIAKVMSLAAPTRGQIVNIINDQFYPDQQDFPLTFGGGGGGGDDFISTELSPLPAVTSSSAVVVTSTTIQDASTQTSAVISYPPEASSAYWNSTFSSEADVTMTMTVTLPNCTSTVPTTQVPSIALTSFNTSVVYVNSTMTHFTTTTPIASDSSITANITSPILTGTPSLTTSTASPPPTSMHYGGGAASLEVLPGWLIGLGMFMIF